MEENNSEITKALTMLSNAAKNYSGPYFREFAEIARRCSDYEYEDERSEESEVFNQLERLSPKEKLSESLAILLKIAFPPNKEDYYSLMSEINEAIEEPIQSIEFIIDGEKFNISELISEAPNDSETTLIEEIKKHIPISESFFED